MLQNAAQYGLKLFLGQDSACFNNMGCEKKLCNLKMLGSCLCPLQDLILQKSAWYMSEMLQRSA